MIEKILHKTFGRIALTIKFLPLICWPSSDIRRFLHLLLHVLRLYILLEYCWYKKASKAHPQHFNKSFNYCIYMQIEISSDKNAFNWDQTKQKSFAVTPFSPFIVERRPGHLHGTKAFKSSFWYIFMQKEYHQRD